MKNAEHPQWRARQSETGSVHGGNIHSHLRDPGVDKLQLLDFSANINPIGPPEWLRCLINRELEKIVHYPDPDSLDFRKTIAEKYHVPLSCVVAANGTTELLYMLPSLFPSCRVIIPVPSYIDYTTIFQGTAHQIEFFPLKDEDDFSLNIDRLSSKLCAGDLVIIGSPNNPTGSVVSPDDILSLAGGCADTSFVIDEAFLDFTHDQKSVAGKAENIITLHSMTKFYAIPGLRLGFGIFPALLAANIHKKLPPWTVNHLAQAVGVRCLTDYEYQHHSREQALKTRHVLVKKLNQLPHLKIYPSKANYLLVKITSKLSAQVLYDKLLQENIIIRVCDNYDGLGHFYFRIAVRTEEENERLISSLSLIINEKNKVSPVTSRKRAASIMFQGTSSNAGKSVLSAAMCRILLQDGVRVAPFKAQNMSLNSFVTLDGLEMGRAQVVQAQAARLDPDVRMNPVLLKPNSDTGSQVIVHGRPVGNMSVTNYHNYKQEAMRAAHSSYDALADEFDVIVLEGAGSPGEVNLKKNDFVNMAMAEYASSPVLLIGDIDRGGVYASFIGTMDVLSEKERKLVAGFIVNRFRGLVSLLDSAHQYVKEYTGRDVVGVVPYLSDLGLPEEDSVSFKAGLFDCRKPECDHVDIALINLPHISNFTDIEPFLDEPDVHLRVVSSVSEIGRPDVIILPGSKNVIGDVRILKENGLAAALLSQAENGCEIVGICGGYQILGKTIKDPHGIESNSGDITGLGLLAMETTLDADKTLKRKSGIHLPSGLAVHGYEIHHGVSRSSLPRLLEFDDHSGCGIMTEDELIWGSYLHGLFDSDSFRRWFIDRLRKRKGIRPIGHVMSCYDLEPAFDRLAAVVRQHIDMNRIYQLLKL